MEELKNNTNNTTEETKQMALDDAARVKVMSPSQLVFKRFIRNKLAVVGFCILAVMFLFSFLGPLFSPYTEAQQFKVDSMQFLKFAEFKEANEYVYYMEPNATYNNSLARRATSQLEAMATGEFKQLSYTEQQTTNVYIANALGEGAYYIYSVTPIATYNRAASTDPLNPADTFMRTSMTPVDDAIYNAMTAKITTSGSGLFQVTDPFTGAVTEYLAYETKDPANTAIKSVVNLCTPKAECLASTLVFHDAAEGNISKFNDSDKIAIIKAYYARTSATVSTSAGSLSVTAPNAAGEMILKSGSSDFALVSNYVLNAKTAEFIPLDIKGAIAGETAKMIRSKSDNGEVTFGKNESGADIVYKIARVTDNYTSKVQAYSISKESQQRKLMITTAPSKEHILGTDNVAMDVMTRIMYGGRVSLMVGFVVVAIEILIGVILGGIAGYFSGWVDVIIMRLIELFNCIPFYPMMLIIGNVLDANDVSANARIFLLMALLGILGWPSIARIVRGQILSLREQDFIIATEACGIPVSRRIFRHLIPNVIPLLIVNATMALGGIIITEATLSFLGLGIKFPAASWGSIINQAQDAFILQSYPWIWIPAGILILLTVLGFNFVGDGLRDAFDPKMKR